MSGPANDVDPAREVNRLHLLRQDWYNGIRDDIDPIEGALAGDFTWLAPDGRLRERRDAITTWTEERDDYVRSSPPVSVELEEVTVQRTLYGVHQVTYDKRVRVDGTWTAFGCSLWLRETQRVATGLEWLHLAETPLPESAEDGADSSENL